MILAQNEGYKSALIHASLMIYNHSERVSNMRMFASNFGIIPSLRREVFTEEYRINKEDASVGNNIVKY